MPEPGLELGNVPQPPMKILEAAAGVPHRSPHKYRHGYAVYSLQRCQTMAQYHALSRNLMHSNIASTDGTYVHIEEQERGKLLGEITQNGTRQPDDALQDFLAKLDRNNLQQAIILAAGLLTKDEQAKRPTQPPVIRARL